MEDERTKVKKGWLAVRVGPVEGEDDNFERFTVPISYLYHPQFKSLLDKAQDVYGFHSSGPLKLPCSVDEFLHIRWLIERESHISVGHRSSSFSFRSC